MDVFAIVALALLVVSLGAVGVAGLALRRAAKGLGTTARRSGERLRPLTDELRAEQAVTALELAALQRSIAARGAARTRRG